MVEDVKTKDQFKQAVSQDALTVVKFYAEWCGPCKVHAPMIEDLSNRFSDVPFLAVNVEEFPELAQENQISYLPAVVFYKGGVPVDYSIRALREPTLVDKITKNM